MTRTGKAVTLARHVQEPMLARHPDDADSLDLAEGHHARIESLHGSACLRVTIDDGLTPGMVFAPFHWTNATSGMARIEAAVHPLTDKVSGQPELKATSVSVTRVIMASEGFLLSRTRVELPAWLQHTRITIPGGEALLFASTREAQPLHARLVNHLGEMPKRASLSDPSVQDERTVSFDGERLQAALFIGKAREPAVLEWLIELFSRDGLCLADRSAVLAGRPPAGGADLGPMVCSGFAVRKSSIAEAVQAGAHDVDALGGRTEGQHQLRFMPPRDQPNHQRCDRPARRAHACGCLNDPCGPLSEVPRPVCRRRPAVRGLHLRTLHRAAPEPVRQEWCACRAR